MRTIFDESVASAVDANNRFARTAPAHASLPLRNLMKNHASRAMAAHLNNLWLLLSAILFSTPSAAFAETITATVANPGCNIRHGPSMDSEIVGVVGAGEQIVLLKPPGKESWIELANGRGWMGIVCVDLSTISRTGDARSTSSDGGVVVITFVAITAILSLIWLGSRRGGSTASDEVIKEKNGKADLSPHVLEKRDPSLTPPLPVTPLPDALDPSLRESAKDADVAGRIELEQTISASVSSASRSPGGTENRTKLSKVQYWISLFIACTIFFALAMTFDWGARTENGSFLFALFVFFAITVIQGMVISAWKLLRRRKE